MKRLFLGTAILILGYMMIVLLMAIPEAGAVPINNAELLPIPKGGVTFTTTGPTEPEFGENVWVFENGEDWKPLSAGFDFMKWNANIYYRYFTGRNPFYYLSTGNEHRNDYHPTPVPATLLLLGTGLIGLAGIRRKAVEEIKKEVRIKKPLLHLVTQRNQPYGSRRKCCERCGLAIFAMEDPGGYVEWESEYTKELASSIGCVRCVDAQEG